MLKTRNILTLLINKPQFLFANDKVFKDRD